MNHKETEVSVSEKIVKFVSEGWKFRIKKVKNHNYIISYQGKKERSLGPYNDSIWKIIERQGGVKATPRSNTNLLRKELGEIKDRLDELETSLDYRHKKFEDCNQIGDWYGFKYCKALHWEDKPNILMNLNTDLEFKRIKPDYKKKLWYVSPNQDICGYCVMLIQTPIAYKLDKTYETVNKLRNEFQEIQKDLRIINRSAQMRVRDDKYGCKLMSTDGFCTYWHYDDRISYMAQKEENIIENRVHKKIYRDNVKMYPLICSSCPSYTPKTNE